MRHFALAGAALAMLVLASAASTAQADNYWGPVKVGNQCWVRAGGNSLGYWKTCSAEAHAGVAKTKGRKK